MNNTKSLTNTDMPTAITASLVLKLILAHTENDNTKFKEVALQIAQEFTMNNKQELALYIYAQFGLVNTFIPQDAPDTVPDTNTERTPDLSEAGIKRRSNELDVLGSGQLKEESKQ